MKTNKQQEQKGQILVLVAILMVAMLAILALVLDGGNLMLNRRAAQNAADAGALAGARTLCYQKNATLAETVARDYAINRNGATAADVEISTSRIITVTSEITYNTFFAHLLGFQELTAEATAAAGCFPPTGGARFMPIAWVCKPPLAGSTSPNCQAEAIDEATLAHYIQYPTSPDGSVWPTGTIRPQLYVIMDSSSTPDDVKDVCGVSLNCDLDGDGNDDLIANGDRSWLDLDGAGGGSSSLISWINGGFTKEIQIPVWIGGQSGVANNVFQEVGAHLYDIFALPVFDNLCPKGQIYDAAKCYNPATDNLIVTSGGNYYYRIAGFAAFVPTCVDVAGVKIDPIKYPNGCPGKETAVKLGVVDKNTKTIEGYFVTGILPNLSGGTPSTGGVDMGVYNLRLFR
jgi:hypothetical protein